ncbi:lamin tail domain-containing 1 [Pelobates cultripes]|uniref:Lamin tail domain-containing 1 n=1 Tax=Pelobates cultripes TaxID=61616 RepID=A0AAD1RUF5_PELCU|nr:lamin tail domain-containing 1 [Pelobates cultripes]
MRMNSDRLQLKQAQEENQRLQLRVDELSSEVSVLHKKLLSEEAENRSSIEKLDGERVHGLRHIRALEVRLEVGCLLTGSHIGTNLPKWQLLPDALCGQLVRLAECSLAQCVRFAVLLQCSPVNLTPQSLQESATCSNQSAPIYSNNFKYVDRAQ